MSLWFLDAWLAFAFMSQLWIVLMPDRCKPASHHFSPLNRLGWRRAAKASELLLWVYGKPKTRSWKAVAIGPEG